MKKLVRKIIHLEKPDMVEAEYVYVYEEVEENKEHSDNETEFRIEGDK